jgi:hypothetical protein
MEAILVQIACRLDKELKKTIIDLYDKADNPAEIEVIVVNQDFENDMWKQSDFPDKVTLINLEESKTRNLAHSRSFCKLFIKPSHKYFMNIDAHSRFDKGWDTILITAYENYGKKCMISVYPKGYQVLETGEDLLIRDDNSFAINHFNVDSNGIFRVEAIPVITDEKYHRSLAAGGFHFTTINWVWEVGYDQYCAWAEHELSIAIRTYCHGYDVVSYHLRPIYHLYDHTQRKSLKSPTQYYAINSKERMESLMKYQNKTFLENVYPLGNIRTLEDFEKEYEFKISEHL